MSIRNAFWSVLSLSGMVLGLSACSKTSDPKTDDKIIEVSDDDAEMNAAIATARATLPQFWKVFDNPKQGESNFSLKVKITDTHGTEHFWVTDITRENSTIFGNINNDPNTVASVELGQRIEVPNANISDWLYMRDGKMVGNKTLKPLLKKMPPEEVNRIKAIMADE